jgi:thiamine biosynthesis lipoprotein
VNAGYEYAATAMGTAVSIMVAGGDPLVREARARRAFTWFEEVEAVCSRYDETSELRQLCQRVGEAVLVSPLLFEVVQFACAVAEASGGAYDPTVGAAMQARGFDRRWRTGERLAPTSVDAGIRWRDIHLDDHRRTITLAKPLIIDLGGIAKGLAVDLAARELAECGHFAIDAGGDVYVAGLRADGCPWSVGVRHPREPDTLLARLRLSECAVCTSGDYERRSPHDDGGHLLDPHTGNAATDTISATVLAPRAMVADALATAAFVLGPRRGIALLEQQGVEGLVIGVDHTRFETSGLGRYLEPQRAHVA